MNDPIYVYVAGPYRLPDPVENTHRAVVVADQLADLGYIPFVPHAATMLWHVVKPRPVNYWLEWDKQWLRKCDVMFRLPGRSDGSDAEEALADELGIPVVFSIEQLKQRFPLEVTDCDHQQPQDDGTCGEPPEGAAQNVGTCTEPPTFAEVAHSENITSDNELPPASEMSLPTVAIVGHARSGKDAAAKWLAKNTSLAYAHSTSEFYWARVCQQPMHLLRAAKAVPARRQELAFDIERYNRGDRGTRLYREMIENGHHLIVGIRRWIELRACLEQRLVNEVLWIDADVPDDPTQGFSQRSLEQYGVAHAVIENDFTPGFFERLRTWCEVRKIEVGVSE